MGVHVNVCHHWICVCISFTLLCSGMWWIGFSRGRSWVIVYFTCLVSLAGLFPFLWFAGVPPHLFKWSVNMSQQIQLLLRVSYINNKWIPQLADSHQNVWKVLGVWRQNTEVYRATLWIKMFMMQLSTCVAFYGYGSFDVTGVNTYGMSSLTACVTWAIMWFH